MNRDGEQIAVDDLLGIVAVAAAGSPRMVKGDWIKPGAAVMDVGVTEVDGKLVGDVDFDAAQGVAGIITPSRRGIGPMTITMLLRNTLNADLSRKGITSAEPSATWIFRIFPFAQMTIEAPSGVHA